MGAAPPIPETQLLLKSRIRWWQGICFYTVQPHSYRGLVTSKGEKFKSALKSNALILIGGRDRRNAQTHFSANKKDPNSNLFI